LRHPWPVAAEHAAEALTALGDSNVVPQLRQLLDAPDPSLPVVIPGTGKLPQVPELVRLNHLRSCFVCHAISTSPLDKVRGLVPTPGTQLPLAYYAERARSSGPFVRADVTYLRQDFSVMLPVEKAQPWPSQQRFDFVIGARDAKPDELAELEKRPAKASYPQREAVLFALKELDRKPN